MNDGVVDARRWWSKALLVGGVVALVLLPVGALGSRMGVWPFMGGFMAPGRGRGAGHGRLLSGYSRRGVYQRQGPGW